MDRMSQQKIRLCSAPRLACAVIAFICGSLIYAMWFGMNSDRDNVHPIITKLMPAGHCTCQTSTSFQCADCLSCLPSSPSEQPQTEPQSWSFEYGRDGRNLSLTRSQCQASFPGLFEDILRGVAYWAARGGVTVPDLDTIQLQNPMVRAMIYNGELYIIESRAKGRDHRVKILAALSSIARALASSPERGSIPHIEFVFSAEDRVDDVNGAGLPIWTFSRKAGEESAWLMPDFGYWAWGHWSRDIGSYGQAVDRVKATEAGLGFRDKERKLVWRGKLSFAPKLRRALLDTARDTPWGDVRELEWASQTNFLSMEDHCRYMFIAHVEGRAYSGSLKYRQACRSVIIAHTLQYIQHHHYLLVSSGPYQNYVEVNRDFSDLPQTMETLLQDPDTAERIADNNVRTFRERYLTPAAETCYWRALWDGWAEVSPDITKVVESGDPGERGLRYEAFILLDSNEMLQFSFRDYIDGN